MPQLRLLHSIHGWGAGLCFLFAVALPARCDSALEVVPTAYPKSRYEALRANSPFSLATAPAATPALQPAFAANWFVTGIGRIGDADFVTVKSRDLATQFSLFGGETDSNTGVSVVSVSWSDTIGKSTVVLRKGDETAKLEFNEAEVRGAPAATASASPARVAGTIPGTILAANVAPGLPRGAPKLSGMARTANSPRFAPAITPPPGDGPSRLPWNAGAGAGVRSGMIPVQSPALAAGASLGTNGAENLPLGMSPGVSDFSRTTPTNTNPSQFAPAITPPPGNGPARLPWDVRTDGPIFLAPSELLP